MKKLVFDIILGMDFIGDNRITINMRSKELHIGDKTLSLVNHCRPYQVIVDRESLCKASIVLCGFEGKIQAENNVIADSLSPPLLLRKTIRYMANRCKDW